MSDLDQLIGTIVSDAQISTGAPIEWMQARNLVARPTQSETKQKHQAWTEEEEQFYLENAGKLSLEDIASALGRTENAIKCHWFKKGLPPPTKQPDYLTTHQIAVLLGVDSHKTPTWVDQGILPGAKIPGFTQPIRRVKWIHFKMWLVRPTSWVYFDVQKIKNASLRRFVQVAQQRWGDEWWTTRQVADYHGCLPQDIKRFIKRGELPAFRAIGMGGRAKDQYWAYWFVKRSDALNLKIKRKSNPAETWETKAWSQRADDFIRRMRAEGKKYSDIARMMKWSVKQVEYRALCISDTGNWAKRARRNGRENQNDL
jgi:hypothetical protein